jgi:malonate transporter
MSDILRLILPFFGVLFLGYGAGRLRRVSEDGLAGLTFFVTYLAMPALFFRLVAEAPLDHSAAWAFVLTTTFSTYCVFAIAFSVGALTNGGQINQGTIQGLVGSYSNIGMLAPALVLTAFGVAAALPWALIFSFDNALVVITAPLMMTLGGTVRVDPGELAQSIARRALLNPLVLATMLGLFFALTGLKLPATADSVLSMLGNAAPPTALFAVGVSLTGRTVDKVPPELPVLIGIKLIAHPLIVYLLLSWVGDFDPIWVHAAVLMAALPPATGVIAYAREYKSYAEWASVGVLLGTVISIATLTVVLILLVRNIVPIDPFH